MKAKAKTSITKSPATQPLVERIRGIWDGARNQAARSVDTAHVVANWLIGKEIVEEEQEGRERAKYGTGMLKKLSSELQTQYGRGFSVTALKMVRTFFLEYPNLPDGNVPKGQAPPDLLPGIPKLGKGQPLPDLFGMPKAQLNWQPGKLHGNLSWQHYQALMKVPRPARDFYEIEAIKCAWTGRQLERQINTLLYERLSKSRDKEGVMALANEGHVIRNPVDLLKEPFILEFLDLPESHLLSETKLETALIEQLQAFLLEMGEGFAFVGRQKRLTLEADHFYPDLVFYHIRLRCYVIIDLKLEKLTHADLGQMLLYVNYYDKNVRVEGDQPTVGLILCTDQNETVAKYVLDDKAQRIFSTKYQAHLPTVQQLEAELRRERELFENAHQTPLETMRKKRASSKLNTKSERK